MTDLSNIEKALYSYLPQGNPLLRNLISSMEYSLKAGGKRIRPTLVLEFSRVCGGTDEVAMPFACALEMIHTYSLIHDDLPCMDNDDMRRGKPSNHIVYGEDIALLAGDALQSLAFETMSKADTVSNSGAEIAVKCINILSNYCGAVGMVGGQVIDLEHENKETTIDVITQMHHKKTGGLIKAACEMGCVCGNADNEKILSARKYGENIGLAFQIMDDILDVTSTGEKLGKPIGSDKENNKSTYVSLLGIDKCRELVEKYTSSAISALEVFENDTTALKEIAVKLSKREK
ncbi:MAG: polyprenyl synthetase family protein [Ruminococcus sp.]